MRVIVNQYTDFNQSWTDPSIPNFRWKLDQRNLNECEEENGLYYATYEPMIVLKEMKITYLEVDKEVTYTLLPGTYGIRP